MENNPLHEPATHHLVPNTVGIHLVERLDYLTELATEDQ